MSVAADTHDVSFRSHTRRSASRASLAAPPEARGAANRWSGVVRGTKLAGKSHAHALRWRLPAARASFESARRREVGRRFAAFTTGFRP